MENLADRFVIKRLVRKLSSDGSALERSNSFLGSSSDDFFPRRNPLKDGIDDCSDAPEPSSFALLFVLNRFMVGCLKVWCYSVSSGNPNPRNRLRGQKEPLSSENS
jgi:hypothetical protein